MIRFIWVWWWAVVPIAINVLSVALDPVPMTPVVMVVNGVIAFVSGLSATVLFYYASLTNYVTRRGTLVTLGVIPLLVNFYNALETSSRLSVTRSDPLRVIIEKRERLGGRDRAIAEQIERLSATTRGDPPEVIEPYIQKLKSDPLYARSKQCSDVTLADSSSTCRSIRDAETRLGAARKIATLEAERAAIWSQLTEIEVAPQTADPGLHTLAQLGLSVDTKLVRAGIDGWIAVMLELICCLMPGILGSQERTHSPQRSAAAALRAPVAASAPPPPELADDDILGLWARERLERSSGRLQASEIQNDFLAWCRSRNQAMPKNWRTDLGQRLVSLGYHKIRSSRVYYENVQFRQMQLKVVK